MIGPVVSGSSAHPEAVTTPGAALTASTRPIGSALGTVTVEQPSGTLVPAPWLTAYTHTECVPGVTPSESVNPWSGP